MSVQQIVQTAKRALGRLTRSTEGVPVDAELLDPREWPVRGTTAAPADVIERAEQTIIRIDVPGATRRSTDITVREGRLEVFARREDTRDDTVFDWHRWFVLSDAVDTDGVKADLRDGVLTIRVPKRAAARPRRVRVGHPAFGL